MSGRQKEVEKVKHQAMIEALSLEEKCHLLSGRDFWSTYSIRGKGIPSMVLSDGPHGLRRQTGEGDASGINSSLPATCFPTSSALACSWDPELSEAVGEALGEEAACQGASVLLGPGMNMKRNPLCGRNFEYFSEDPYLTGKLAAGYIRGVQKNGISACAKHFAANNSELRRMASNSVVDERTLRELYLTAFEIAVKEAHPKCLMSAYNMVNGVYANENEHLLQKILREEWGYDGMVVSDWGACNDFVDGVRAGCNLEMPSTGGDSAEYLQKAVYEGRISEAEVDRRVDELLDVVLKTTEAQSAYASKSFDKEAHHALARKAAAESLVLLKNEGQMLPLKKGTGVALIGIYAKMPHFQGDGSSRVNPTRTESLLELIQKSELKLEGWEPGYAALPERTALLAEKPTKISERSATGKEKSAALGEKSTTFSERAAALAAKAETVVLCLGLDENGETEGLDRHHMHLPQEQIELLKAVAEANPNLIVVLSAGAPVELPWIGQCRGLLYCGLNGQAGAAAVLDALTGRIDPCGRLAESWPLEYGDVPTAPYFPAKERSVEYREGLYVGYRYYETAHQPVRFPFGFGLSYTSFAYSGLKLSTEAAEFTIMNQGDAAGAEVAQLYISAVSRRICRPARELKGFQKVFLEPGESRRVTIPLDDKAFRYFNTVTNRFETDGGEYEVQIGKNASEICLKGRLTVAGTGAPRSEKPEELPSYASGKIREVPDAEFERLLGTPIPDGKWSGTLQMNDALCQMSYAKSGLARLVARHAAKKLEKGIAEGRLDHQLIYFYNMPFRALGKLGHGSVSQDTSRAMLTMANGHFFAFLKGIGILIAGRIRLRGVRKRSEKIR